MKTQQRNNASGITKKFQNNEKMSDKPNCVSRKKTF